MAPRCAGLNGIPAEAIKALAALSIEAYKAAEATPPPTKFLAAAPKYAPKPNGEPQAAATPACSNDATLQAKEEVRGAMKHKGADVQDEEPPSKTLRGSMWSEDVDPENLLASTDDDDC